MSSPTETIAIPTGLIINNPEQLAAKAAAFRQVGATGVHMVFDFDRTLTVKKPGAQDEVTTWHILREHLPKVGQDAYQELFERYRNRELSGEMTYQDAEDWWSAILDLFVQHKLSLADVEEDFLNRATIRPGTAELFAFCRAHDIPTIILSAGTRDVIELWCQKYAVRPTLVISTALTVNAQKQIVGWEKDTLVHVRNKSEATHPELIAIRAERPKAFLLGDSLDDAAMASGSGSVIRTRILDPRADERMDEQEVRRTFEKFDALIRTGSLQPLQTFVGSLVNASR